MAASTGGRPPQRRPDPAGEGADAWYLDSPSGPSGSHGDKRAARIARQIEADVIARGWPVGASLGSEQSLQDQFGVSRSVLREAVRLVEHHQVARTRRGPNGGLFVTAPDAMPATRALVVYLEYIGATLDDLLEARQVLEPLAAALSAERVDAPGVAQLDGILGLEKRRAATAARQRDDLHVALGALSGNPVLYLFVDVLSRLTGRYADLSRIGVPAVLAKTHGEHRQIVAAVRTGDAEAARRVTERHLESIIAWLHEHYDPARSQVSLSRPDGPARQDGKLAERVAAAIRTDIVAGGWRVGTVVGTELQLLQRYGVSRSALREAVRLLEHHGVARMRRGPGGGLVVAAPEAQASVETIALYLEYRKPSRSDLTVVREAIELELVTRVAKRRDDVAVQSFLASGRPPAHTGGTDILAAGMAEYHFHRALAQLAGNRVMELFLRILVEMSRRQWISRGKADPETGDVAGVENAHSGIVDAIANGDDVLARRRIRAHLDDLNTWWF